MFALLNCSIFQTISIVALLPIFYIRTASPPAICSCRTPASSFNQADENVLGNLQFNFAALSPGSAVCKRQACPWRAAPGATLVCLADLCLCAGDFRSIDRLRHLWRCHPQVACRRRYCSSCWQYQHCCAQCGCIDPQPYQGRAGGHGGTNAIRSFHRTTSRERRTYCARCAATGDTSSHIGIGATPAYCPISRQETSRA